MNKLILAMIFLALLLYGSYEWTVILEPPETDMEVVLAGRRARSLMLEGYTVYLNGSALTMEEALEMVNY